MKAKDVIALQEWLSKPINITILTHYNPDGDALGASLALSMYLQQMGHKVSVIVPNSYPEYLAWMPQCNQIFIATEQLDECENILQQANIIFCLDFNAFNRIGILEKFVSKLKTFKVLIDHHIDPKPYFDIIYSLTNETSSTSELIYFFISEKMGDKKRITKEIAECLYVGIMTDTGSLSYSCNNPSTYMAVSALVNFKIDVEQIHRRVYDTFSNDRIRLLGYCLSERLQVLEEYATSFIFLTKEDLKRFNYQQGDTEGIVNYGLSIKTVRFTAFFTERDDRIRISFRSKGDFDVNIFARDHFNGGGHRNASGGNSYEDMPTTIEKFINLLKQYKTILNLPWDK